jgi:hypothetical protein
LKTAPLHVWSKTDLKHSKKPMHRFGASLNRHLHYHCGILDGVFDPLEAGGVEFRQALPLTPEVFGHGLPLSDA